MDENATQTVTGGAAPPVADAAVAAWGFGGGGHWPGELSLAEIAELNQVDADFAALTAMFYEGEPGAGDDWVCDWEADTGGGVGGWEADMVRSRGCVGPVASDGEPGPVPESLAGWVRQEWWHADLDPRARALLTMPVGVGLVAALERIGTPDRCPVDHRHPDPAIEAVDLLPVPGAELGFPCPCQLLVAAAWEAATAWVTTRGAAAITSAMGESEVTTVPDDFPLAKSTDEARVELAAALAITPASAHGRLRTARALTDHQCIVDVVADGLLFKPGVDVALWETRWLSAAARARALNELARRIRERRTRGRRPWTPPELSKEVKTLIHYLAADEEAESRKRAKAQRRVTLTPDTAGMSWLSALIADVDAIRIYNRLTAAAAAARADGEGPGATGDDGHRPTLDEIRADLLVQALIGRKSTTCTEAEPAGDTDPASPVEPDGPVEPASPVELDGDTDPASPVEPDGPTDPASPVEPVGPVEPAGSPLPVPTPAQDSASEPASEPASDVIGPLPSGTRPDISVVVDLATLLGLANNPAQVRGLGPVPADIARNLAADGRWRLLVTDTSNGLVMATSPRTYTPSAALARLIRAREPHCRMPGCTRAAVGCDLDHTIPWPGEPGSTASNLGPLCRRHHNSKTHHGYQIRSTTERGAPLTESWTWTFPSGLTHTDGPEPPLPESPFSDATGDLGQPTDGSGVP
ncbi:MAG: hypothetical protein QG597_3458 [Actinomycetota bacterium]|nr:hypothetical protein [Actinomycetota bacterium]